MRPAILYSLFTHISTLKGIGPKLSESISKFCGPNLIDLLWHLPVSIIDRKSMPTIDKMQDGHIVTVSVEIQQHIAPPVHKKSIPYINGFVSYINFFPSNMGYLLLGISN